MVEIERVFTICGEGKRPRKRWKDGVKELLEEIGSGLGAYI